MPTAANQFQIISVIEAQNIKIYQPPIEEDDEAAAQHARSLMAAMPFAVIGSEKDVKTGDGRIVKGRQYSWGVAEVENEDHCDFKKLRSILIRTHMLDLIHTTEELHYEAYRAQQMETRKFGEARPRKLDNPKFKEEEEALRKRFTEQVKIEEQRFRQWEQKLIAERDRLNKDLEQTHARSSSWRASWRRCKAAPSAATAAAKLRTVSSARRVRVGQPALVSLASRFCFGPDRVPKYHYGGYITGAPASRCCGAGSPSLLAGASAAQCEPWLQSMSGVLSLFLGLAMRVASRAEK